MSQTSDDSTDVTIFVERFGTTPCEVGNLITTELVNLLGDVCKHSAVVQLLPLFIAWRAVLLRLSFLHGHLSAVFGSVNAYACAFKLLLLG